MACSTCSSRNFPFVNIAKGRFVWLIGDDDLLMPNAIFELNELIKNSKKFEYI